MNILLTIDGVLRRSNSNTQEPIRDGVLLYRALKANNQITLLTDEPYEEASRWLTLAGLSDFDGLMGDEMYLPGETVREAQIRVAKSRGPVAMLVDPDPAVIATVYDHGFVGLLFVAPSFAAPQYRPDAPKKRREWAAIEAAVVADKINKSKTKFATGADLAWDE